MDRLGSNGLRELPEGGEDGLVGVGGPVAWSWGGFIFAMLTGWCGLGLLAVGERWNRARGVPSGAESGRAAWV